MIVYLAGKYRKMKVYKIDKSFPEHGGKLYIEGSPETKFGSVAAVKKHIDWIYENSKPIAKGKRTKKPRP